MAHRWDALLPNNDEMEECRLSGIHHVPFRFSNGDTRPELLIKSRYLPFKSAYKWTEKQKERARILFDEYPDIKIAYSLSHSPRMIFSKNTVKDASRLSMARWYNKVDEAGMKQFNVIAATFYEHYDEILNFYNNRSSNATAESSNAKIKLFRANLRGVIDKKFSSSGLLTYMLIPTNFLLSRNLPNIHISFIIMLLYCPIKVGYSVFEIIEIRILE